jgi:hypothetical protein
MSNARIERMIRELKAEPAEQCLDGFVSLVERLWSKVETDSRVDLSLQQ